MNIDFAYRPMPIHADFHRSGAYERAMFGAFGSGKTYAIVAEAIAWCLEQPGIRGLICRKTFPELRDTVEPIFKEMVPPALWRLGTERKSGGHLESFTFPNGSKVLFRSLDDWNKHRSLNVGFIAYDEANEIDLETYMGMASRVRQRDITAEARAQGYTHEITRRGIWLATNPAGHDWLYERFVNPMAGEKVRAENGAFFRSTSLDNPFLPPEYIDYLLSYPEPWVKRYVLCSFDAFGGQIYEGWSWDTHVVEPLREYPQGAAFWMGMDPGTRSPTAGLWVVMDRETRCLTGIAEYEESRIAAVEHAAAWRAIEAKHRMRVSWRIADPNITTADRGTNMKLSDQYRRLGYTFQQGPRQHKDRIPMLGQLIHLGRFKLTKDCPRTYEAILNYKWEDITPAMRAKGVDPKETPLKKNDHLVDCAQYLSSRFVMPTKKETEPDNLTTHEEFSRDVHKALRKQKQQMFKRRRSHASGLV
jgi:PBSX family phage terminase large subunit